MAFLDCCCSTMLSAKSLGTRTSALAVEQINSSVAKLVRIFDVILLAGLSDAFCCRFYSWASLFGCEFRKRWLGVFGKSVEDHLSLLSTAERDVVLWADFMFLTRILVGVVKVAVAVKNIQGVTPPWFQTDSKRRDLFPGVLLVYTVEFADDF